MEKIPVIINNRDLLTWPKAMLDKIKTYKDVGDIFIVDNASTYEPLLEWYKTKPCEIIRVENLGHTSPWSSGLVKKIGAKHYVITDPDLGIDDTPDDTLEYLYDKMESLRISKVGLGLDWESTPSGSLYFNHVMGYEKDRYMSSRFSNNVYLNVAIDTTFALYSYDKYFIGGASTGGRYKAKHFPWYMTENDRNNNDEFMYYIKNASDSSSYKTFLGL